MSEKYKINRNVVWKLTPQRAIIFDTKKNKIWSLNQTGKLIWKGILNNQTRDEIATQICKKYEISYQQAKKDVSLFINDLKRKKIIN